jgi:hypothetical protein
VLGLAVLLGFVFTASAPNLEAAQGDTTPTDIWERWGSYSEGQQEMMENELTQLLQTGTGPGACLPECSDTYLSDLTSIGTEGQYPELAHSVYSGLDVAREDWIGTIPDVVGESSITWSWPVAGQIIAAFAAGVGIGNEIDHWFGWPTVTGMFSSAAPQTIKSVKFVPVNARSDYGSPAGHGVSFCTGSQGTGNCIGSPLEHGDLMGPTWDNDVNGLGSEAYSIAGDWSWYINPQWTWREPGYAPPCEINGCWIPGEIAVQGTKLLDSGLSVQNTPFAAQNDMTANADAAYPASGTPAAAALFASYGDDLPALTKHQISHWVDPVNFPANPMSDAGNLGHYTVPSCVGMTGAECEAAIDELAHGSPAVELNVADIDGANLDQPASDVIGIDPEVGTDVTVETAITITVNPDVGAMPYIVPAIAADDTFETYSQKIATGVTVSNEPVDESVGDILKGPNAVLVVVPAPGTRQVPSTPITVRTNPPDWPDPVASGGNGCPAPLSTVINFGAISGAGLQNKFPFAIFAWMHSTLSGYAGSATAPSFTLSVLGHSMHFDMSMGDGAMAIIRAGFMAITLVGLVWWLGTALVGLRGD